MSIGWLLRLYPREWRERYGEEFEALLEEHGLSPLDTLDVALGAIEARRQRWVLTARAMLERRQEPGPRPVVRAVRTGWVALIVAVILALAATAYALLDVVTAVAAIGTATGALVTIGYIALGVSGVRTLGEIRELLAGEGGRS